jgi:peptidoglycan/xylan/chitin deacetylase (PgdA/CDA1 family)
VVARALACALGATVLLLLVAAGAVAQPDYSEVSRGDPATGMVALTFDAGGVAGPAAVRILDILRERGLRVTFFLSGQWVDRYPELARQVALDGHELANHSYTHLDFANLTDAQIVWELDYTDHVVYQLVGVHTRPYFRPPFGSRNARVLRVSSASGFRSVMWSLDSGDWRERVSAGQVADRVIRFSQAGDIVVHHIAADATAIALPTIVDALWSRGLHIGTLSEVLGLPPATEQAPAD